MHEIRLFKFFTSLTDISILKNCLSLKEGNLNNFTLSILNQFRNSRENHGNE